MKNQKNADSNGGSTALITIPEAPVPVDTIYLGQRVSLTAIEAIRRGRSAGESHFPGIGDARLEASNGMTPQPDSYFDDRRELPIEIGGARFGQDPLRRMTALLGIKEDAPLKRISEDVMKADKGDNFEQFTIKEMVDAMLKVKFTLKAAVNHAINILHYVHHKLIHRPEATEATTLKSFFEEFRGTYSNERAKQSLGSLINQSIRRRKKSVVELSAAFESFAYAEPDKVKVRDTAEMVLKAAYEYELAFWDGVELCKNTQKFQIRCKRKNQGERMLTGILLDKTDNPRIVPASRTPEGGNCDITIVRNTLGNVGIFWKKGIGSPFQLWRMIQAQEMLFQGKRGENIQWMELTDEGHPDIRRQWRLVLDNGLIANGINQNDIQETGVNNALLQEAVQSAYHPLGVTLWRQRRHIKAPPRHSDVDKPDVANNQPASGVNPTVDSQPKADAQAPAQGKKAKVKEPRVKKSANVKPTPSSVPAKPTEMAGKDFAAAFEEADAKKEKKTAKKK